MPARGTVMTRSEVPAPTRRSRFSLKVPRDPGLAALRRAARAAIVIPSAFALGTYVLHAGPSVIFLVFGCFALLVISDFGGLRPARALAYIGATLTGAVLVALGTLVSLTLPAAVAATFAIGLLVTFVRVFGGYVAAGQLGMLLAFVVAVAVPAPASAIPSRVEFFLLAGSISTLAGVFLWPRFEKVALRKYAAKACLAVADLLEHVQPGQPALELQARIEHARQVEQKARHEFSTTVKRPAGPARRDRAFVQLLIELQRIVDIVERPFYQGRLSVIPQIPERTQLTQTVVAVLRSSADVLTGGTGPDLRSVDEARGAHRAALDRWSAQELRAGRPAEQVLEGLDVDHTLRILAYLAIALGANAIISAGGHPEEQLRLPLSAPGRQGINGVAVRVVRTVRAHLDPSSTVLQNSVRVGAGLAIGVLVANGLGLQRGFWVVLGTLQVLRSNAMGTGRTTVQAIAGNLVGVAIGGLFAVLAGGNPIVMWVVLPFAVFLAAYASSAVGFAAGQAGFSILLIVFFNLITPLGWKVGLVRIEDLLVGVAISLVVGLLLWPRGVRRTLALSMSRFYRAVAGYVDLAFNHILGLKPPGGADSARRAAIRAGDLAGEAFDAFVLERASGPLSPDQAGLLLSSGNHVILGGDALEQVASTGYVGTACAEGARLVEGQVVAVLDDLRQLSDRLSLSRSNQPLTRVSPERLRAAALDCLRRWRNDDAVGRGAIAVVIGAEWARNLERMEGDIDAAVMAAVETARMPWWR